MRSQRFTRSGGLASYFLERPPSTSSTTPFFLLVSFVGVALCGWASWRVKRTLAGLERVGVRSGRSGRQAAGTACLAAGTHDLTIERHQGFLSDHYDPRSRSRRLSPAVHDGRSLASIAVAAHQAGHAIQDSRDHVWLGLRSRLVPVSNFGSRSWSVLLLVGIVLGG